MKIREIVSNDLFRSATSEGSYGNKAVAEPNVISAICTKEPLLRSVQIPRNRFDLPKCSEQSDSCCSHRV